MAYKKLYRSSTNKFIGGVCGGLGDYFNIDPIIFRLIFAVLFFAAGGGFIIYIIMWIFTPIDNNENDSDNKQQYDNQSKAKYNYSDDNADIIDDNKIDKKQKATTGEVIGGIIIIIIGTLFLFKNYFHINFNIIWPIILIIIGIMLMLITFKNKDID